MGRELNPAPLLFTRRACSPVTADHRRAPPGPRHSGRRKWRRRRVIDRPEPIGERGQWHAPVAKDSLGLEPRTAISFSYRDRPGGKINEWKYFYEIQTGNVLQKGNSVIYSATL